MRINFFFTRDTGFTLMEILVSISIIAIVLVSIFKMHNSSVTLAEASRFNAMAPGLARKKIADISINLEDVSGESGDFGENFPGFGWSFSVTPFEGDVSEALPGKIAEKLKKIQLNITYMERYSFSITTWRFDGNG